MEGNRCCFASLDRNGFHRIITDPVGIIHRVFLHRVGTGFQIGQDHTVCSGGVLANQSAVGLLDGKDPACDSAAVGGLLDDFRPTDPFVGEGHLRQLSGFHRHRSGRVGILFPVFHLTVCFRDRIGTGFQRQCDNAGIVRHIVSDHRTAGILHLKVPACNTAAVGGGLDDLGSAQILVGEGHLGSLTSLDRHRLAGVGIVLPIGIFTFHFGHRIGAGFQIHSDDTAAVSHIVSDDRAAGIRYLEVPACNSTAIGGGFDDLGNTPVLVPEGHLGGFTRLDSHCSRRIGIILPILLNTVRFCDGVSTGFQIQGDNAAAVGHIVPDHRAAGILHCEVPTCDGTSVSGGLDDLRLTTPLVREGHACRFIGLYCDRPARIRIVDPIFPGTIRFRHRVGTRHQIHGNYAAGIRHIGTDNSAAGVLHLKMPACFGTAVGCRLDDFGGTLAQLVDRIDGDGHIGRVLRQCHCPVGLAAGFIACREHRLRHHIGAQRQLPGFGIAAGIGGADDKGFLGGLIHSSKGGTAELLAVGVLLIDRNIAADGCLRQVNVIPRNGFGFLGTRTAHGFHGVNLRASAVAHMDDEVTLTAVAAVGGVEVTCTGIDGNVLQRTLRCKHNHITRNQILVCLGFIGVLGDTASVFGSQGIQCPLPGGDRGQVVEIAVAGVSAHFLGLPVDRTRIHTFNVGQIITQVIGHKGGAYQAVGLEVGEFRSPSGHSAGIGNGFVTVGTGTR